MAHEGTLFLAAYASVCALLLIFIQVFAGHVIFRHFSGAHFSLATFSGFLDARYHSSLERVSFLDQLVNTLRICAFDVGQAL